MSRLTTGDLLDLWERGQTLSHSEKALLFATPAQPGASLAELATLPIGRRDRALMLLRESTFGGRLLSFATCPSCYETAEFELDIASFIDTAAAEPEAGPHQVTDGLWEISFRLPNSLDLIELAEVEESSAHPLLTRCVLAVEDNKRPASVTDLPEAVVNAVIARMEALDPLADVTLDLKCTGCGHEWELLFDIVTFLDRELDAWARGVIRDVHTLARAYGWTEQEVLALGPNRRRYYLDLVAS